MIDAIHQDALSLPRFTHVEKSPTRQYHGTHLAFIQISAVLLDTFNQRLRVVEHDFKR